MNTESRRNGKKNWSFVTHNATKTWQPYGTKSRRKFKQKNKKLIHNVAPISSSPAGKVTYPKLCKQTLNEIRFMKESPLFSNLINHLRDTIKTQQILFSSQNDHDDSSTVIRPISVDIICYGIGNFSTSHSAMQQLALLATIRDYFQSFSKKRHRKRGGTAASERAAKSKSNATNAVDDVTMEEDTKSNDESSSDEESAMIEDTLTTHANSQPSDKYVFSWQKSQSAKSDPHKIAAEDRLKKWKKYPFIFNKIEIYEPMLTAVEKNILTNVLKMRVLESNTEGNYPTTATTTVGDTNTGAMTADVITIAFMPHCPRVLYNNFLATNWSKEKLSRLFLVGNSFSQYMDLAQFLGEAEKANLNYVMTSCKLGLLTEQSLDAWVHSADSIQNTQQARSTPTKHTRPKGGNPANKRKANKDKKRSSQLSTVFMDEMTKRHLAIAESAFAFQQLMYFPVSRMDAIDGTVFERISEQLRAMHPQSDNGTSQSCTGAPLSTDDNADDVDMS